MRKCQYDIIANDMMGHVEYEEGKTHISKNTLVGRDHCSFTSNSREVLSISRRDDHIGGRDGNIGGRDDWFIDNFLGIFFENGTLKRDLSTETGKVLTFKLFIRDHFQCNSLDQGRGRRSRC